MCRAPRGDEHCVINDLAAYRCLTVPCTFESKESRVFPRACLAIVALASAACGCRHFAARPLSAGAAAATLLARSLAEPGLREFVDAATGERAPEWPLRRWDLRNLTLAAIYFSPSLAVARADAAAAAAAIESAGARPNPTLAIAPEWNVTASSAVNPWLATIHLDWPIETAGKRGHRIERASAHADAARLGVAIEVVRIRRALEAVVIEIDAADARLGTLRDERAATDRLADLLDERLESGAVASAEVAPIRFAQLQVAAELASAEADASVLRARLAEALGLGAPGCRDVEVAALPPVETEPLGALPRELAVRAALIERSDVRAALADYAAAEALVKLEVARQYPDLHVGTGYGFDQGASKWSVGVSLDLPLLDRNEGPIAEAEAARQASAARFAALQAQAVAQVDLAIARRDSSLARVAELAKLEADRSANLRRAADAVELGAADRTEELAARIERIRAGRAVLEARTSLRQALAELAGAIDAVSPEIARAVPERAAARAQGDPS